MNAYINRVVLLAPCFGYLESGASKQSTTGNQLYSAGYIKNALNGIGIYASGDTTTWEADVAKICDELSSDLCAWAQGLATDEANSLKVEDHAMQTGEAKRFQEYVDNWSSPDNIEGTLYPIDTIDTVPVSIFAAEND